MEIKIAKQIIFLDINVKFRFLSSYTVDIIIKDGSIVQLERLFGV